MALDRYASLMVAAAERLHFAAITIPDGYWETAPDAIFNMARDLLLDFRPRGGYVFGVSNVVLCEFPLNHYQQMVCAWESTEGIHFPKIFKLSS